MKLWIETVLAFVVGMWEFRSDVTTSVHDDLIDAYDRGRDFAHRLTFRHWDR